MRIKRGSRNIFGNDKKAQLFIIAALIIVGILFSLVSITNYIKGKPKPTAFYDLSEEISSESSQVLDYATYTKESDVNKLIANFTDKYASYAGENVELVFVYGNTNSLTIENYTLADTGGVCADLGEGSCSGIHGSKRTKESSTTTPSDNSVKIDISNATYNFQLNPGENFFFVIKKEIGGEQHVATPE